jgi:phosphatidylinositol-3-phosphatase
VSLDPLRRWEQRIGALAMPSPLVWTALIAAFLGFGVLIGRATGPESLGTLAAKRVPLKLFVARVPAASTPSTTPTVTSLPPVEAQTTPEASPEPAPPAKSAKPAVSSGTSSKSSGSSSGNEESSAAKEGSSSPGSKAKLPAIKHVFVVMLNDEPYATAFGPASPAHYLAGTLEKQGELLVRYYAVAHDGLADGIALLSGQGPTEATAANCPQYTDVAPASVAANGQMLGNGCVYPASTGTLMGQLSADHLTWKAYIEGIDEGATGGPSACAHPLTGAADPSAVQPTGAVGATGVAGTTETAGANGVAGTTGAAGANGAAAGTTGAGYQTWRNPFVYFHSITDSPACAASDVGIGALRRDLAREKQTASFTYIAPGPCGDGNPTPCVPGAASGMAPADGFLRTIVPEILSSAAYKNNGLLAITVDNAPSTGEYADSSSCCGQPRFPNLPAPSGAAALSPAGGGQVGLLLLSPFIKKGGGLIPDTYNHFSLLATIEQTFGLPRLGYPGLPAVKPFSPSLFSDG